MESVDFEEIYERAVESKGSEETLLAGLPSILSAEQILAKKDSEYLSLMTKTIFQAGFIWKIVEHKWAGFEEAFYEFDMEKLNALSPPQWDTYANDTRIIRNMVKVYAVRENVEFLESIRQESGGFGKFLTQWPADDQFGLLTVLKKRAARLGGLSGQYFLRRAGWDGFILSKDVIACLQRYRLFTGNSISQKEFKQIQERFNVWHQETQLPYTHLSMILARAAD